MGETRRGGPPKAGVRLVITKFISTYKRLDNKQLVIKPYFISKLLA